MPEFVYKVRDQNGKIYHGVSEAENADEVKKTLRDGGGYVLAVGAYKKNRFSLFGQGIKIDTLIMFTHELTSMLESGITILRATDILWKQVESQQLQIVISKMKNKLSSGATIHQTFNEFPEVFPPLYRALLGVAEIGADISQILRKLLQYLTNQKKFQDKFKQATTYPLVVVAFAVVVVMVMLLWVIPVFQSVFEKMKIELPFFTQIVINISKAVRTSYFWLIIIALFIGAVFLYRRFMRTIRGKEIIDAYKLKLPLFGKIFYTVAISRFVSAMSLLISAGLPLTASIEVAKEAALNSTIRKALDTVQTKIVQGEPLGVSMAQTQVFPPFLSEMITVGEASGSLREMLERMAIHFEEEFENRVSRFLTMLEPILIIFVGGLVLFVLMAIYMPIFSLWNNLSSR
ncbi:MAG: type II secretion system F family protein [Candidatus Omnitrophica bacterium]|nr:type II secretion system F family protein [Candidatus Omnitrophota bacterium]